MGVRNGRLFAMKPETKTRIFEVALQLLQTALYFIAGLKISTWIQSADAK